MSYEIQQIGPHVLYRGDCLEVLPMLAKVDVVVSDPPFGMAYQSARRTDKHSKIGGDNGTELLEWICQIRATHSKYIFCRWNNLRNIPEPKSVITWVKNNWTSGDLEHSHARQTELIAFYPGQEHYFPDGRPPDVVRFAKASSDRHPTEKPVDLMETVIGWTHGIVCDPFMGSGTTGVACVNLGRKFIGIELERKYFDIACKRIEEAVNAYPLLETRQAMKPVDDPTLF